MRNFLDWVWSRGIVSTFLSGLFALLPIVVTVAIVIWVTGKIQDLIGPGTTIGNALRSIGLHIVTNETAATILGWCIVLAAIWAFGLLVKTSARGRIEGAMLAVASRIPFVKGVYGTARQVVAMMQRDEKNELRAMTVVYCAFGESEGAGFLGLLASPQTLRFRNRDCQVVYVPTSPLPMSGGIVFVPVEAVVPVEMSAEQLMQVYLSLGVLAPNVIPASYQRLPSQVDQQ